LFGKFLKALPLGFRQQEDGDNQSQAAQDGDGSFRGWEAVPMRSFDIPALSISEKSDFVPVAAIVSPQASRLSNLDACAG
jgi:hypothetical protein